MLEQYRAGDWQAALGTIIDGRDLAQRFDLVELYGTYVTRIRKMMVSSPVLWDGVYVAENK
jgi:hypothetical protein